MQTIPERVNAFISSSGAALCDRCIQEALDLAQNNQVQQITSALATTSEFVRGKAACAACRKVKAVTRRAAWGGPAPEGPQMTPGAGAGPG